MAKAHLISSNDPIPAGSALVTSCGVEIKRSYYPLSIDQSGVTGRTMSALISANTLLLCRKCQVAPLPGNYVYVVVEATEKLLEAEDAKAEG